MDEAYTIGIRLALEDGASSGIAAIGVQLAALDQVVAAGLGVLGRLHAVGEKAMDRPVTETVRQLPPVSPEAAFPPEHLGIQTAHAVQSQAPLATEARRPVPAAHREDALATAPAPPVVTAPSAQNVRMGLATPRPRLEHVVAPLASEAPAAAPVAPPSSPGVPAVPRVLLPDLPRPSVAPVSSAAAASVPRGRNAVDRAVAPAGVDSRVVLRTIAEPGGETFAEPASPRARGDSGTQPSVAETLPERPAQEQTAARGDIYLDGARMGRWIVERLAREAERPRSGGAGFDGRMSPAWSGTL